MPPGAGPRGSWPWPAPTSRSTPPAPRGRWPAAARPGPGACRSSCWSARGTALHARAGCRGSGRRPGSPVSSCTSTPSMSISHERISRRVIATETMSRVRIASMPPRMAVLATVAALVLSAPAARRSRPRRCTRPRRRRNWARRRRRTTGARRVLLGLALAALAGAGCWPCWRSAVRAVPPADTEVVDQALAAMAAGRRRRRSPRARRRSGPGGSGSSAARAAAPVIVEPPEPKCAWRPRVVAEPPLPAFGPGSHTGSPSAPPPPD